MSNANHNATPAAAELLEAAQCQAIRLLAGLGADATADERVRLLKAVQPVLDLSAAKRTHVLHEHGLPPGGVAGGPPPADAAGGELELDVGP